MKQTAALAILILLLLKFSAAQPSLGIGPFPISFSPDTVAFNQTVQINVSVQNKGNSFFSGTFHLYFSVNGDSATLLDTTDYFASLNAQDSFDAVITNQPISPAYYSIGDNIVVIWPIADMPGIPTADSGTAFVYVDSALGIGDPFLQEQIKIFYGNSNHDVLINYGSVQYQIEDVGCYSILGQQIMGYNYPVDQISFAENSPGIFLLVIRTKQGKTLSFKILRM